MANHREQVEFTTLEWVDWFNNRRRLDSIGNIPPIEFEQAYYQRRMRSGRTQITESPENPLRFTFRVDTSAIVMVCHTQFPGKSQVRNPLRSTLWLLAGDALFLH